MCIVPQPQKVEYFDVDYHFDDVYRIEQAEESYLSVVNYIKGFLTESPDAPKAIIFKRDETLGKEEYKLELDENIVITSKGPQGAFRGASTLKQLAFFKVVKKQHISDYPDIEHRGFMLDISRGKVPTLQTLFEYVDILSDLKYNQFQLYLDNIVVEYKHYPEYCQDVLTIDELRELDRYCKERFIDLVPNQNGLGHMENWLKIPEFKPLAIVPESGPVNTLNPFDERSLDFVKTLLDDTLLGFTSDYVNINMDEPFGLGKGQTRELCSQLGVENVYVEYLNRVIEFVQKKHHKTPMYWDDFVISHKEALEKVSRDSIALEWGYEAEWPFYERCEILRKANRRFYTCPSTATFASVTGRFDVMLDNVEAAAKSCIAFGGEGFLITEWGDGGHPQFSTMFVLPLAFGAACAWHYNANNDNKYTKHLAFSKHTKIVQYCEDYVDHFVFGVKGLGKILHRAENYYLVENKNIWCGTNLNGNVGRLSRGEEPTMDADTAQMLCQYMQSVRKQLGRLDKDNVYVQEAICNVDMVVAYAKCVVDFWGELSREEQQQLKRELMDIKERFLKLWRAKNKDRGLELSIKTFDGLIRRYE